MPEWQGQKHHLQRSYSSDDSLNAIPDLDDIEAEPLDDLHGERNIHEVEDEILNEIPELDDDPEMVFLRVMV